jgi:hypothetical protein
MSFPTFGTAGRAKARKMFPATWEFTVTLEYIASLPEINLLLAK